MMEERTSLLSVLNSMSQYILVFNEEGRLQYANQSISAVFGLESKSAKDRHFRDWVPD
jgi:PAS domain S-box-containing protein